MVVVVAVVEDEDDARSGGGDGRDVDSDGLTLLEDKLGDWRVGDWTGPKGEREASTMRKKRDRSGIYRPSDSPPLVTPIFPMPIIPIEPPKLFIPIPFIP